MKADKYENLKKSRYRKQLNEARDCSVMAIAIVCRLSYKQSHTHLAQHGRGNRKGMFTSSIILAAEALGFDVTPVKNLKQKTGSKYTAKTIGNKLKRGYYIAFVHGHVLGVVNGEVYDWTDGRKHHIKEVYKVTRKRKINT